MRASAGPARVQPRARRGTTTARAGSSRPWTTAVVHDIDPFRRAAAPSHSAAGGVRNCVILSPALEGNREDSAMNSAARSLATAVLGLTAATVVAQSPVPPPAGLLSWWPMDGSAEDYGALALNGAMAQTGGAFPAGQVLAAFGPAAPDGHIAVPDAPELHLTDNFTFELWVRVDALSAGPTYLVNKGSATFRTTPFSLGIIGSNSSLPATNVTGTRA